MIIELGLDLIALIEERRELLSRLRYNDNRLKYLNSQIAALLTRDYDYS